MGPLLSQRLRISFGYWQVEDAQTTPTTTAKGHLHAPCSGQLDLPHCPPTATQRSFPRPQWPIWAQWFTRESQFRQLLYVKRPTFHRRSNPSFTRSLAVAQLQIQSIRPRMPQTNVLVLGRTRLSCSGPVPKLSSPTIRTTATSPL